MTAADHHTAIAQGPCQNGPQADAHRERRLSSRARPTHRSRYARGSLHGVEKRTASHAGGRLKRKTAGSGMPRFYTEVVPRGGIEPPTLRFSVACSTN